MTLSKAGENFIAISVGIKKERICPQVAMRFMLLTFLLIYLEKKKKKKVQWEGKKEQKASFCQISFLKESNIWILGKEVPLKLKQ